MQEATFLILTALAAGSQHGYGIMTDVAQISGGRVRLRAGTLYAGLDRLRDGQLIEVDRDETVDSRRRRYYRLTPSGARRLAAEAGRLQANAVAAIGRLRMAGGSHDRGGRSGARLPAAAGPVPARLLARPRGGDARRAAGECAGRAAAAWPGGVRRPDPGRADDAAPGARAGPG